MRKKLLLILMVTAMIFTLCACGETTMKPTSAGTDAGADVTTAENKTTSSENGETQEKATSEKDTKKELTNSGKYYKLYKLVKGYDIGNTGSIRLDCDPDGGYVQFDLSEWLEANTFFSTDYLPKDGEYFKKTYDGGGGEPFIEKIYLEYSDEKITIYFYEKVANPDTGDYDLVRQKEGSEFKLEEDSRFN